MISPRSVLVIEDEPLVSMMLEDILDELGAKVAGVAANIPDALTAIGEGGFDCALLDMNLHGERSDALAKQLAEGGIPFAILSGGSEDIHALGAKVFVPKPYQIGDIEHAMLALDTGSRGSGEGHV